MDVRPCLRENCDNFARLHLGGDVGWAGKFPVLKYHSMKPLERDLLILLNETKYSEKEIEEEVSQINIILSRVETLEGIAQGIEILELQRGRLSSHPRVIRKVLQLKKLKSFQFILHKN